MNVIFLDIDGVLTNARTCIAYNETVMRTLDPVAVRILATICKRSDTKICITSSRRLDTPKREDFVLNFAYNGGLPLIKHLIMGESWRTPILETRNRELEIESWLLAHPDIQNKVIIDDEYVGATLEPFLVQTLPYEGFSFQNYLSAVKILEEKALHYGNEPIDSAALE